MSFEKSLQELIIKHADREGTFGIIAIMRRNLRSFVEQEPSLVKASYWKPPKPLKQNSDIPNEELSRPA